MHDILRRIPKDKLEKVFWLDPNNGHFPRINPLYCEDITNPYKVNETASFCLDVFQQSWEIGSSTPRLKTLLKVCFITLILNRKTLADLPYLFWDEAFRGQMIAGIPDTKHYKRVKDYWIQAFNEWPQRLQIENSESSLHRVFDFLTNPIVQDIVDHPTTQIDFTEAMEKNYIFLIRLASTIEDGGKEGVGSEGRRLIGMLVLSLILRAARSRPERKRNFFSLVIDEVQKFTSPQISEMFEEIGEYRIACTFAYQHRDELDTRLKGAVAQTGIKVVFRLTPKDTLEFSPMFAREAPPSEIRREPTLAPAIQPIQSLLGARGGQENPDIDWYIHNRLTVFDDAIKNSHQQSAGMTRYGEKFVHVPVSELDRVRRELNRILYEVMVEKNPRKEIPIKIFSAFIEAVGFSSLWYLDDKRIASQRYEMLEVIEFQYEYINSVDTTEIKQALLSSFDAFVQNVQKTFPLLWTLESRDAVIKAVAHMFSYLYKHTSLYVYYTGEGRDAFKKEEELIKDISTWQDNYSYAQKRLRLIEDEISFERRWKERLGIFPSEMLRLRIPLLMLSILIILLLIIAAEIWLITGAINLIQQTHGGIVAVMVIFFPITFFIFIAPIEIGGFAILQLNELRESCSNDFSDEMNTSVEGLESKSDDIKLSIECARTGISESESTLSEAQKNRESAKDAFFQEEGQREPVMTEDVVKLAGTVLELREFMEALAENPIQEVSRWKESGFRENPQYNITDMEQELLNLEPGVAWCRIVDLKAPEGQKNKKVKIRVFDIKNLTKKEDYDKLPKTPEQYAERFQAILEKTYAKYGKEVKQEKQKQVIPQVAKLVKQETVKEQPAEKQTSGDKPPTRSRTFDIDEQNKHPLLKSCPSCGHQVSVTAKYCDECGYSWQRTTAFSVENAENQQTENPKKKAE